MYNRQSWVPELIVHNDIGQESKLPLLKRPQLIMLNNTPSPLVCRLSSMFKKAPNNTAPSSQPPLKILQLKKYVSKIFTFS